MTIGRTGRPHISRAQRLRGQLASLLLVVGLHALALAGLWSHRPSQTVPLNVLRPMMVTLVSAPEPQQQTAIPPAPAVDPPAPPPEPEPPPAPPPKPVPKAPQPAKKAVAKAKPAPAPVSPASRPERSVSKPTAPAPRARAGAPSPGAAPEPTPPLFSADYLQNPAPKYPPISRRRGESGRVFLRVLVGTDGRAEQVQINRGSGYSRLDDAARKAVKGWRFVPARLGPQAVRAWVIVPVVFSLKG